MKPSVPSPVRSALALACLAVLVGASAGCRTLAPKADPTRYFVLDPLPSSAPVARAADAGPRSVGLDSITWPGHLADRAELPRRAGPEVAYADRFRWAEAPAAALPRILAAALEELRPGTVVEPLPWPARWEPEAVLRLEVRHAEGNLGAPGARVAVRWTLRSTTTGAILGSGLVERTDDAVPADDPAALAAALRALWGAVAGDLARVLAEARR